MQKPILVTGATGYVGSRCAAALIEQKFNVRWGARRIPDGMSGNSWVAYGDLADSDNLDAAVAGCGTVVHFAGHTYVPDAPSAIAAAERVNIAATERLALACARHRVERLIFISSALVLAGSRDRNGCIDDLCTSSPLTAYARTKASAEARISDIGGATGLGWIVLRPPMVYGPDSPGNFGRLVKAVDVGVPLPLGRATAVKSFICVDNLISAISTLIANPQVRNTAFLVSDAEVTSTAGLVRLIADGLGRRSRLLPLPPSVCRAFGRLIGKEQDIERLFEPLQVKSIGMWERLQWRPPISLECGVRRAVAAWHAAR